MRLFVAKAFYCHGPGSQAAVTLGSMFIVKIAPLGGFGGAGWGGVGWGGAGWVGVGCEGFPRRFPGVSRLSRPKRLFILAVFRPTRHAPYSSVGSTVASGAGSIPTGALPCHLWHGKERCCTVPLPCQVWFALPQAMEAQGPRYFI